jgi:hypothetical protein
VARRRRTGHTPTPPSTTTRAHLQNPKVRPCQAKTTLGHGLSAYGPPQPQGSQHPLFAPFGRNAMLVSTRGALDSKDNHHIQIARRRLATTLDEVLHMVLYQRRTIMDAKKKKKKKIAHLSCTLLIC